VDTCLKLAGGGVERVLLKVKLLLHAVDQQSTNGSELEQTLIVRYGLSSIFGICFKRAMLLLSIKVKTTVEQLLEPQQVRIALLMIIWVW
jgi:hypothetical protein